MPSALLASFHREGNRNTPTHRLLVMTFEESAIVNYLQGSSDVFMARKEIARKALKRQVYEENPHWVDAPLASLLSQRVIEQNDSAQYRLKKL